MDSLSAVQARIGEIQARFLTPAVASAVSSSATGWASAAAAAGLTSSAAGPASSASALAGSGSGGQVVAAATKYLGVPYVWGGTDPATGLDCSGFTQRVYADVGIDLPRVSSQQATAGRPVASLADARPGDLLFFDYDSSRPGIDHVGIFIGDGKMIAAPQPGDKVKIQSAGSPTVIRRMLPDDAAAPVQAGARGAGTALGGVPYADLFTQAGARHGVSPALLAAVAKNESGFDTGAVSPAGAQGIMQFMPATARGLGVNPFDPAQAVDGAARYLSDLLGQFGSTDLALAAYNAGPGNVRKYGGIPPFAETQAYVRKVTTTAGGYQ